MHPRIGPRGTLSWKASDSNKTSYNKTFPHASSSDTPGLAYLPGRGWIPSVALMEAKGDPGQSSSERGEDVSVLRLRQKERKTGAWRDCAEQASVWHAYRHTDGEMWVHTHSHTHPHRSKDSSDRQLQRCDVHWAWLTYSGCTHKHSLSLSNGFPAWYEEWLSPERKKDTETEVVYLNSMVSLTFNLTLSLTYFPPPRYLFILDIYMSLHRVHPFFFLPFCFYMSFLCLLSLWFALFLLGLVTLSLNLAQFFMTIFAATLCLTWVWDINIWTYFIYKHVVDV